MTLNASPSILSGTSLCDTHAAPSSLFQSVKSTWGFPLPRCALRRLLEADSKSMRSMSGSRRNSGSSLVSSSSASSNLSHLEEDTWILWGRIVNEWEEWRRKKDKLLKELIRKGIPHHFRAIVWQLLGNATDMPVKNQYSELLKMSSPCEKLIRRDIARTYPEHEFFKGQDSLGQEVLFNVMKAYSLVDREVGYCQGSAFIVGLLLMQMPEEEAFCVFVRLMQEYRLRELFKPSMAELGLCIYQFEYLLQEQLPELNVHFRSQSFHTSMYASSWFLTLFLTFLPLPVATRIFDIFMYEGLEIIFRVGLAILQYNQTDLIQLDMEGMSQHFQKVIPHQFDSCPDKLILRAYQVKYNPKRMKKLEKEYTTIKNKEMEEQIEIKRRRLVRGASVTLPCRFQYTEQFVSNLQTQLEQSRLREAELLGALKEMQDKVLDLEKRSSCLPDENNMAALQEEVKQMKLRELETLRSFREMQDSVAELNQRWQVRASTGGGGGGHWKESPKKNAMNELQDKLMTVRLREAQAQAELREVKLKALQQESQNQIHSKLIGRHEQERSALQDRLQMLTNQNKALQAQLNEMKRKQAEFDCKSKEEVMAVRLREADSMAAMAELRQKIAELEIQKEEGLIQGQLNHSDSRQYINQLRDQIAELKNEVVCDRLLVGLFVLNLTVGLPCRDLQMFPLAAVKLRSVSGTVLLRVVWGLRTWLKTGAPPRRRPAAALLFTTAGESRHGAASQQTPLPPRDSHTRAHTHTHTPHTPRTHLNVSLVSRPLQLLNHILII
uniref:Si:ch211-239f4.1 n=1 Tax=Salarias fasciatus TaxID=181472 RepID=A0A672G9Q8_SALFA